MKLLLAAALALATTASAAPVERAVEAGVAPAAAPLGQVNALRAASLLAPFAPAEADALALKIGPDALALHASYTFVERLAEPGYAARLSALGMTPTAVASLESAARRTLAAAPPAALAAAVRKVEAYAPSRAVDPSSLPQLTGLVRELQDAESSPDAASLAALERAFSGERRAGDGDALAPVLGGQGSAIGAALAPASFGEDSGQKAPPLPGPRLALRAESRAKSRFLSATFLYHLATSVMLLVQQTLIFDAARLVSLARGAAPAAASLQAAGLVFGIATLTGATRVFGNPLAGWLSRRAQQRNLGGAAAAGRGVTLAGVALVAMFASTLSPIVALGAYTALYSLDWLLGSLEDQSISTVPLTQAPAGSAQLKSWSTLPRFFAELNGFLGPLLVLGLLATGTRGFAALGQWLAPALYAASAAFYFSVPRDVFHTEPAGPLRPGRGWKAVLRNRELLLIVAGLALLSTTLLKGPLSLNMASLILGKTGLDLKIYTAILSAIFGAGLGLGAWMAHVHDDKRWWRLPTSGWLVVSAAGTALLALSWLSGYHPAVAFLVIAPAWLLFAATNAVCRLLLNHRLQERVAEAGPDANDVIGLAGSLSTAVITALRVVAGLIFFAMAGSWQQGFGLFGAALALFVASQIVVARLMATGKRR